MGARHVRIYERTCAICGSHYKAATTRSLYCSIQCKSIAQSKSHRFKHLKKEPKKGANQ